MPKTILIILPYNLLIIYFSFAPFPCYTRQLFTVSFIAQLAKNPPAMQETLVCFLDPEDPLEKE